MFTETEYKSTAPWPKNSVKEINECRAKLYEQTGMMDKETPCLFAPSKIVYNAFNQWAHFPTTYGGFLKKNDMCSVQLHHGLKEDEAYLKGEFGCIHIIGITYVFEYPCSFCGNPITVNCEAVKLYDNRIVCNECYTKVFDSVLNSHNP